MASIDDIGPFTPKVPKTAVHGLRCVEPNCPGGVLLIKWSYRLKRWFYGCEHWPQCNGTLPARDDGSPRGEPRTKELQGWRNKAHEAFDPIWKNGHMKRKAAYYWLQQQLGWDHHPHMGSMTVEQCQRVIELATAYRQTATTQASLEDP